MGCMESRDEEEDEGLRIYPQKGMVCAQIFCVFQEKYNDPDLKNQLIEFLPSLKPKEEFFSDFWNNKSMDAKINILNTNPTVLLAALSQFYNVKILDECGEIIIPNKNTREKVIIYGFVG
jgi:hypothetical protein